MYIFVYICIENFCPGSQGPGDMHSQKNFRVLSAISSPKWREHIHAQKLSFVNIDYRKKNNLSNLYFEKV